MNDTDIVSSIGQLVSKDIKISIILINQLRSIYVMVEFTSRSVLLIVVTVLNLARSFHEVRTFLKLSMKSCCALILAVLTVLLMPFSFLLSSEKAYYT